MKQTLMIFSLLLTFAFFGATEQVKANTTTHVVKQGDTFYKLSNQYNQPIAAIKRINNRTSNAIYVGERLTIPAAVSNAEKDLLARLVHAEAKGEPYAGKVAVATVVLNRVDSKLFPNSVKGVINEVSPSGHYAFTPIKNGAINNPANAEAHRAVKEALNYRGLGSGSLYFYNPRTSTSKWVASRPQTVIIGNHVFAR
ncbi:cell wall hydrolase [Halalkalibacter urbisdiaboli]|uniref:cell wall hydrolase n=1 Tax=Halalkalibacter urbisdiaboli TaxID=1960589 RepID=UPI000B431844|nr:cell wall hydrolase [Halalkalibacter urbisdiaboli]